MKMDNWDEVRTAYHVARLGTVSGAAEALGVHHATVIRHIDALEERLGVKLFQRHPRGYTATEAGLDLLQVGQATADQFEQLYGRLRGQGAAVTGELVVTTVDTFSQLLVPVLAAFQRDNPELRVRLLADPRVFRLEYGEAHVALRVGSQPDEPDNIVQKLFDQTTALYAHKSYVAAHGQPASPEEYGAHRFVGPSNENHRAAFYRWQRDHIPAANIVFRASENRAAIEAVEAGAGIGFMPTWRAESKPDLVLVEGPRPEWTIPAWLVTHVDLHRTAKVQSFTAAVKAAAKTWR